MNTGPGIAKWFVLVYLFACLYYMNERMDRSAMDKSVCVPVSLCIHASVCVREVSGRLNQKISTYVLITENAIS